MRKAIVGLVWHEVWENFKKNFWCIVGLILYGSICSYEGSSKFFNLGTYLIFWFGIYNLKIMPLRIYKGVYACPLDEKGKLQYLAIKMGVQTFNYMLMILFWGLIFFGVEKFESIMLSKKVLWVLMIVSAFYLVIIHGANEEAKVKVDERGYRIFSKAERMIRTNFLILLMLQWAFYLFYIGKVFTIGKYVSGTIFLMCSLANVIILVKYLKPYLLELIAYERVYNYKPKEESVQYDI